MDLISIIAFICVHNSDLKNNPKCESQIKQCVEWAVEQPIAKSQHLSEIQIANALLFDQANRKALCSRFE